MAIYDSTNINIDSTCFVSNIQAYIDAMKKAAKNNTYDNSNIPKILKKVNYNSSWENGTEYVAISNPTAVISGDLDSLSSLDNINCPQKIDDLMSASTILNAFRSMITNMSKVHNFYSQWNHQSSSGNYLVGTLSGKAFFKDGLNNITTGSTSNNTASVQYTRSVPKDFYADALTVYDSALAEDKQISADSMKNLMQSLYDNWTNNINNKFTYQIWSCHYNCHYNCHSSGRGRR